MTTNFDQVKIFENKIIVQRVNADLNQACNLLFVYKIHKVDDYEKDFGNRYSLGYNSEKNSSTLVQRMSFDAEK